MKKILTFIGFMVAGFTYGQKTPAGAKPMTKDSFLNSLFVQKPNWVNWDWFGSPEPDQISFTPNSKAIYIKGAIPNYVLWNRKLRVNYYDTLDYHISGDTMFLISKMDSEFMSRQKVEIIKSEEYFKWTYVINYKGKKRIYPMTYLEKLKKEKDTINLKINFDALLLDNTQKPMVSIYVNGNLYFKRKIQHDTDVSVADNFIQQIDDSAIVKVVFSGTRNGKPLWKQKTFVVKGVRQMALAVDIRYPNAFSKCPYRYFIIKRPNLHYPIGPLNEIVDYYYFYRRK